MRPGRPAGTWQQAGHSPECLSRRGCPERTGREEVWKSGGGARGGGCHFKLVVRAGLATKGTAEIRPDGGEESAPTEKHTVGLMDRDLGRLGREAGRGGGEGIREGRGLQPWGGAGCYWGKWFWAEG